MNDEVKTPNVDTIEETLLDLDSVEDIDFDSIQDAPGFIEPPDGVYKLNVEKAAIETYKTKEGETKRRFAHYYAVSAVIELADPTEQEPKAGDKFSERFMVNDVGIQYWKTKAKAILGDIGKVTVQNALAELSTGNYTFKARVNTKKSKGKDGKEYKNVQVRVLSADEDIPF